MDSQQNRILVVEDDAATRDGLTGLLEAEGFAVTAAANGREALDILASIPPPQLILLDLLMPVMDGWQFLAEHRRGKPSRQGAPVVLLSGLGFISGAPGVADFLRKPVEPAALLACVRRFCGTAQA